MDNDFVAAMAAQDSSMTEDDQKKAGQPVKGSIGDEHKNFLQTLIGLLDSGEIDPEDPQTFLKMDVYNDLDEEWQDKVSIALTNIAHQVRLIDTLRKEHSEDALHLQTMVEQLWEMKQRIEEHHDVFKF